MTTLGIPVVVRNVQCLWEVTPKLELTRLKSGVYITGPACAKAQRLEQAFEGSPSASSEWFQLVCLCCE